MFFDGVLALLGKSKGKQGAELSKAAAYFDSDCFRAHPGYKLTHVHQAIARKKYFKPESAFWLLSSINSRAGGGYAALDTAIRKNGSPLSQVEVKAYGLRGNFILCHEYLNSLTEEGLKHIKTAAYSFAEDIFLIERLERLQANYQSLINTGLKPFYKVSCGPDACKGAKAATKLKLQNIPSFPLPECTQDYCHCTVLVSCL